MLHVIVISILNGEGSVLHIVVQDTSSSRKQTSLLEVNLINVGPSTGKDLLLHVGGKETSRLEADVLGNDDLALTLAGKLERASDGNASDSLLRRSHAPKKEGLQGEVGRLVADRLESRGAVEASAENVLHRNVGLRVWCHSGRGKGDIDYVEAIPVEAAVGADRLEGCYGEDDLDVVKLGGGCQMEVVQAVLCLCLRWRSAAADRWLLRWRGSPGWRGQLRTS
jgi:hypothetical protein